ncbi:MAG: ECF transporter S component [Lachnospiraceae bacterium]|nr:ECF transporter S component [Lachnospiraceae bacterium]
MDNTQRNITGSRHGVGTHTTAKQITLDAMFVALTLIFTAFVNIKIPSFGGAGGLIHLGNVPLFIAAILYGRRTGTLAGAIGMGLFDVMSGWVAWAPCTVITCGLMGFVVGVLCRNRKGIVIKVVAMLIALIIKITGYFVFESFVLGSGIVAAIKSIPGNIIQVGMAGVIVLIVINPLEKGLKAIER